MNLAEIKAAVDQGKQVFWTNSLYQVVQSGTGSYDIVNNLGRDDEFRIGLTWTDGVTMNGKPEEFFCK